MPASAHDSANGTTWSAKPVRARLATTTGRWDRHGATPSYTSRKSPIVHGKLPQCSRSSTTRNIGEPGAGNIFPHVPNGQYRCNHDAA